MFARVLLSALALQSAAAWTLSQPPRTLTRTVRGSTPVDEPLEAEPAKPVDELAGATGIDGTKLRKPKSGQYGAPAWGARARARATCCRPARARASPTVRRRALADLRKDMDTSGAGFNQFDPVLSATGAISRRFGIGGGLALLALLAATEGSEIVKTLTAGTATAGDGAKITTASGLVYSDVLVGAKNGQPGPATGAIIGADIRLSIGDKARRARAALSIARVRRTSKV